MTAEQYEDILARASSFGYSFVCELWETDTYMNGIGRNFAKTDEALRVRETKNATEGRSLAFVAYKGPKLDEVSMTRKELEVQVADAAVAQELLGHLGFPVVLRVSKHRHQFSRCLPDSGSISLCLDHLEGIGHYLELEQIIEDSEDSEGHGEALENIFACLRELGVSEASMERRSYLEILLQEKS